MSIVYYLIVFFIGVAGGIILGVGAWARKEAGTILVSTDEDGSYLFLETDHKGMSLIQEEKYVLFQVKKVTDNLRFGGQEITQK